MRSIAAIEQLDRATVVVSVKGEVDLATAPALERTLRGVADDQTHEVIVDLTDCTFLDSQGLMALLGTKGRLERSNRRLALVISDARVLQIFRITQFDEPFEIHRSLAAAGNGYGHG